MRKENKNVNRRYDDPKKGIVYSGVKDTEDMGTETMPVVDKTSGFLIY